MAHREKHDIPSLEGRIKNLSASLNQVADSADFEELFIIIHRPGFTTPAEYLLISGVVDAMQKHVEVLGELKQVLLKGSSAVELNPQPLPPVR